MGQGQSQPMEAPMAEWDPSISPEERAQAQEELRAKQQAALDKRLAPKKKKATATASTCVEVSTERIVVDEANRESDMHAQRSATPESAPESKLEPSPEPEVQQELSAEEQAQAQIDMRAKQQAALNKRFAAKQNKSAAATNADAQAKKRPSALEQASRENVGYRNMDAQAQFRSWN